MKKSTDIKQKEAGDTKMDTTNTIDNAKKAAEDGSVSFYMSNFSFDRITASLGKPVQANLAYDIIWGVFMDVPYLQIE